MKRNYITKTAGRATLLTALVFASFGANSQTNVFDDIIVPSANHSYLETAILQQGLEGALQDDMADLTVFAPDNAAFDNLAAALNTDINGLLALPNLSDILLYHVLGVGVPSSAVNNGDIVSPLSPTNTLKLTKTSMGGMVYANQAMVNAADLAADNGYVHSVDAVLLPYETVVDVAIDNSFNSLTTAVVTAELLPALTNPLGTFTVFAPTDQAFDDLATALGTDINGLLALPNLADILTYHVLGTEVASIAVTNGLVAQPLSATNTLKLTLTGAGSVFVNQAEVTMADVPADNGVVHVLDAVVLPYETVVDVAIDNGFTSLTAAVIEAELIPALTNPLGTFTVFAPTDQAFDDLATALGTDLNGVLAHPELADILLYHVLGSIELSGDLMNGDVPTLNGQTIAVDLTSGVMINSSNVTAADLTVDNGVVHVIDAVLVPSLASIEENNSVDVSIYPNPASDFVNIDLKDAPFTEAIIMDASGKIYVQAELNNNINSIDISSVANGSYLLVLRGNGLTTTQNLQLFSGK